MGRHRSVDPTVEIVSPIDHDDGDHEKLRRRIIEKEDAFALTAGAIALGLFAGGGYLLKKRLEKED